MTNSARSYLSLPAFIALFATMILLPTRGSDASDLQQKLNGGYYLLHQLLGDEDQLPILLDLKHAPPELVAYADQISKQAKDSLAKLEQFQDNDHAIRFDRNPLPPIEQDTRDSIKGDKQHQLLFGTSNSEFDRALVVAQIEACTYAAHLSKVLSEQEKNPTRVKTLQQISGKWMALRDEAFRLLRNY